MASLKAVTPGSHSNPRWTMNPMPDPLSSNPVLIAAQGLSKSYRRGRESVMALHGVSFEILRGEFVAITGPSGSGKTTLLNLLGAMDSPSSGSLLIDGEDVGSLTEAGRTLLRRHHVGFVFQHFGLVPTLTVAENIGLPSLFARRPDPARVSELVRVVGLEHRQGHYPSELSGGEMQRTAIARALMNRPSLLLADEPTGNLDSVTGESILEVFRQLNLGGLTLVVVTHNESLAAAAGRRIELKDGQLRVDSASAGAAGSRL
jgi:ABC-type lipoprotein export system ATPase subunit